MSRRSPLLGLLLATTLAACAGADGAPIPTPTSSDEAEAEAEGALGTAQKTQLETEAVAGARTTFTFRFERDGAKRSAFVKVERGAKSADLPCTQLTNYGGEGGDEVVTHCEEAPRPGYEYVSVYFRFHPDGESHRYEVIAVHPTELTPAQHALYTLLTGKAVVTPPLAAPARYSSHREESGVQPLSSVTKGGAPLADPIALAAAVHDGPRAALGRTAREGSAPFTVQAVTTYSDFSTLVYPTHVQGRGTSDGLYHSVTSLKTTLGSSSTKLRPLALVKDDVRAAVDAL